MLDIIYRLSVFFEDCYREFSVREYSREIGVSPPTASKMLKGFVKEELLSMREERGFLLFRVNRESFVMRDLSRVYWAGKLGKLNILLRDELYSDAVVLFGSLSKLEVTRDSDVDVVVFSKSKKDVDLSKFEKKLGREIQIFVFESLGKINKELRANVINGYILGGYVE